MKDEPSGAADEGQAAPHAEAQLIESQQRLALATSLAHIGIWDWDVRTNQVVWDAQMYALHGIPEQDISTSHEFWRTGTHPEDRARMDVEIAALLHDKSQNYQGEYRVVWPTGEVRHIETHVAVQRDDDGSALHMIGVSWDITQRKQAEEQLRKTVEQLSEAQRLVHMGSWEWDPTTNEVSLSDEMYRLYGLDPKEHVPTFQTYLERVHPEDRAFAQEIITRALRDHQPWEYDARIIRADGAVRILRSHGSIVVDTSGQVIRTHGTVLDVTERKQAEEERTEMLRREQAAHAEAQATAQRIAQLQKVTAALAEVITADEVARVIAEQGMAALEATTGTIVLLTESGTELEILCAIGYPEDTVRRWSRFPLTADTPISQAARTGEPVWLESTEIAVGRYPHLAAEFVKTTGHCWASIPLMIGTECIGALGLRFAESEGINEVNREFMLALAHQCAQALQRARLFKQVRDGQEQLQELSRQLMAAQENERRHIARELHDEIGQALTALKINIRSLLRLPDVSALVPSLREDLDIIDGVLQRVRDLSLDLRPPMLDDLGLVAALHWSVFRQAERAGFKAEFLPDAKVGRLPAHIETTCYRVAQEALTNISRHASAQNVRVELRCHDSTEEHPKQIELVVQDDGAGFDVAAALQGTRHGRSFGLLGMQERVLLARGDFKIHSTPHGTVVRVRFPLEPL